VEPGADRPVSAAGRKMLLPVTGNGRIVVLRNHAMKEITVNTWSATQTRLEPALCVAARQHRLPAAAELELDRAAGRCRG